MFNPDCFRVNFYFIEKFMDIIHFVFSGCLGSLKIYKLKIIKIISNKEVLDVQKVAGSNPVRPTTELSQSLPFFKEQIMIYSHHCPNSCTRICMEIPTILLHFFNYFTNILMIPNLNTFPFLQKQSPQNLIINKKLICFFEKF